MARLGRSVADAGVRGGSAALHSQSVHFAALPQRSSRRLPPDNDVDRRAQPGRVRKHLSARPRPTRPSTHCRRWSDPPVWWRRYRRKHRRRPLRCVAGSVPPRAPVSLPTLRGMPAVAGVPMRRIDARRASPARISRKDGGDRTPANPLGRERTSGVGWPTAVRPRRHKALLIALQSLTTEGGLPGRPR